MTNRLRLELAGYAILSSLALFAAVALMLDPIDTSALKSSELNLRLPLDQPKPSSSRTLSEKLSNILARPLFSESRRPFAPMPRNSPPKPPGPELAVQPAGPVTPSVKAETLVLKGILLQFDIARALIASESNLSGVWVKQGESIDGWVLVWVTNESVRLAQGKREAELELYQTIGADGLIREEQPFSEVGSEYKRK
jgi:hypothetical protein